MKDEHYVAYRDLGNSLAFFRRQAGLTQQQLAEKIDVNYETISRMENANTGISLDMLLSVSKALGIPLGELFTHAKI